MFECEPSPDCKYHPNCHLSNHHLYWPKDAYQSQIERRFRNLPDHQIPVCRNLHDVIHEVEQPPIKPDRGFIIRAINKAKSQ